MTLSVYRHIMARLTNSHYPYFIPYYWDITFFDFIPLRPRQRHKGRRAAYDYVMGAFPGRDT